MSEVRDDPLMQFIIRQKRKVDGKLIITETGTQGDKIGATEVVIDNNQTPFQILNPAQELLGNPLNSTGANVLDTTTGLGDLPEMFQSVKSNHMLQLILDQANRGGSNMMSSDSINRGSAQ